MNENETSKTKPALPGHFERLVVNNFEQEDFSFSNAEVQEAHFSLTQDAELRRIDYECNPERIKECDGCLPSF